MMHFDADRQRWAVDGADAPGSRQYAESVRLQRQVLNRVVAVLTACGLAFGVWALGWKDEPEPVAKPAPAPSTTETAAPPTDSPSASTDEQPSPSTTVPPGYTLVDDQEGFSLAVPETWERRAEVGNSGAQVVFYENGDRSRQLQIFPLEDPSPYESLKLAEKNAEKSTAYKRIGFDSLDDDGRSAARLEYTFKPEEYDGTRHVIDYRFQAEDDELYAIVAYGPVEDGTSGEEEELLRIARAFFCPSGADCHVTGDAA